MSTIDEIMEMIYRWEDAADDHLDGALFLTIKSAIDTKDAEIERLRARLAEIEAQEPVAWVPYWGLGQMKPHPYAFVDKAGAELIASQIKSNTEVRALYARPVPAQAVPDADARLIAAAPAVPTLDEGRSMSKKLNPNEAPTGYVAVAHYGCTGCVFDPIDDCAPLRAGSGCTPKRRKDCHSVIFIKREPAPAEPAPLDARITIRVPKATKAKAQRIGAAAVIAAIEGIEECTSDASTASRYGMSPNELKSFRDDHNHECGICRSREIVYVDHDHATGKPRGLLCPSCNSAIGLLGEDAERFAAALAYLEKHRG